MSKKYRSLSRRHLLAILAAAASIALSGQDIDVVSAETVTASDVSVTAAQAPASQVAPVVNDEAIAAEEAAYQDNQTPAGVNIGIKEWKPSEGETVRDFHEPSRYDNQDVVTKHRQDDSGQYYVTVGSQEIKAYEEKPEVAAIEASTTPSRIINQVGSDPATQMNFSWYTTTAQPVAGAKVQVSTSRDFSSNVTETTPRTYLTHSSYLEKTTDGALIYGYSTDANWRKKDADGNLIFDLYSTDEEISADNSIYTGGSAANATGRGSVITKEIAETIYHADVKNLTPGTLYYFRVGSEGNWSPVGSFTTAAEKSAPFSFVHYTDSQNAYWNENVQNEPQYTKDTMEKAVRDNQGLNFSLNSGDFVEISHAEDEWLDILGQTQDVLLNLPHAMVAGNHDQYSVHTYNDLLNSFNNHINVPQADENGIWGGSYYSFNYNGTHFTILNTNDDSDSQMGQETEVISDAQMAWLRQDLQSESAQNAYWRVVAFHKPLFSGSYHSLQDTDVQNSRDELIQVLTANGVDVVLSGHDHVNSFTKPVKYDPQAPIGNAAPDETALISRNRNITAFEEVDGTVFVTLNTAGRKLYDDIYNESLDHIAKVRPNTARNLGATVENIDGENVITGNRELAQRNLDYWNTLFMYQNQPADAPGFVNTHQNSREGTAQNYATYNFTPDYIEVTLWQVSGELGVDRGEPVEVETFIISKGTANATAYLDSVLDRLTDAGEDVLPREDSIPTEEETKQPVPAGQGAGQDVQSPAAIDLSQPASTSNRDSDSTEADEAAYASVEPSSSAVESEEELPTTGSASMMGLAAASIISGLGLTTVSRKKNVR